MSKKKQSGSGQPQIKFDAHNFRYHNAENKRMIHDSLSELGAGRSIVMDNQNELIAGNGVYEQAKKLGMPVRIIETDGTELIAVKRTDLATDDTKRKKLAAADNAISDHVEWNAEEIRLSGLDDLTLQALHIELPEIDIEDDENDEDVQPEEKIEEAEKLMDEAMRDYCREAVERLDICMSHGFLPTMRTPAYARLHFLKAKYYGRRYERNVSTVFCPRQFYTSGEKYSYYEILNDVAERGKAGIAGLRSLSHDGDLSVLFCNNYPIGVGGRMPLDFPVHIGRLLIRKYGNKGRILDPCHGWGGRLVSALLEEVEEYVGFDPSPVAHDGVALLYETYKQYQYTKATLIQCPYEDAKIDGGFDFALTSPPYFDVEQYEGEQQAHERYGNYALWVEKFYKPLILDTMARIKYGCCFALQVGSQRYPLKDDAIRIATDAGYTVTCDDIHVYKQENNGKLHNTDDESSECIVIIRK